MGPFSAGQVVFLPFPFSDLSRKKLRPVLLLAYAGREDWIVCQITSNPYSDSLAIELDQEAFCVGGLNHISYARPGKLFTAHQMLIASCPGELHPPALDTVRNAVVALIQRSSLR